MHVPPSISEAASDPLWLADRYDPGHDAVHFRRVTRAQHHAATFLTPDYLGEEKHPFVVRRADVMAVVPPPAPVHFIFHSAYCCSTLLARAFDLPGYAMGLKEPLILNDMIGWRHRGGGAAQIGEVLDNALTLLARPFGAGEAVIIKPSNVCNGLAETVMALRPAASALLLYAPLPVFLGSVARKGMWGRLWVRELMVKQIKDGFIDLGLSDEDYLGLTDLQAAAVGWLAQHALFSRMIARLGSKRVYALDSETLLAAPATALAALSAHFGLALDGRAIDDIVAGPAFTSNSKSGGDSFNSETRVADQQKAVALHGEEIAKVSAWAAVLAANNQIAMDPAKP